jgi:EpsI family protein
MMPLWTKSLVPVFLATQGLLVFWTAGSEQPPAPPALSKFPAAISGWTVLHEDPIDADVANTLRADRLLSRTYANSAGGQAGLFVAWFQSQRAGASQPHSPKVCLPASGWIPVSTGELSIATSSGNISVNRYMVANGGQRAAVLYWYQSARRVTAGEWSAKLWLVADALRDRRTDTALVRIVVEDNSRSDAAATLVATDFTRAVYPVLRDQLPR